MIKLTLTEKGGEPKLLTFDKDEITIGRVSGNDIVLAKGNVSKRHSRFTVRASGQIEVADMKSTNGTYVNGRKISGPLLLSASDRVYVGDFLIGVDLGGGFAPAAGDDFPADVPPAGSGARRLPIPPPPPPPRSPGSTAARLPDNDEDDGTSGGGEDEEEELGLAARPPRSGRMPIPPPPPPPPRRPPTPLASRALADSLDDGFGTPGVHSSAPAPVESGAAEEDTGSVGLFAHPRGAEDDLESAGRRVSPGARPGATAPPPAPVAPAFGGGSAPVAAGEVGTAPEFEALVADPSVTQILITAPDAVLVDRGAGLALHPAGLGDPNAVADTLWRLANTAFPPPAPDNPVVDVRLPDGTRISAAFPPAAPSGVVASIRKPVLVDRTIADLVPGGSKDAIALLESAIAARRNLLVVGDAVALPHALGALAASVPVDRRVVAIGAALPRARGGWMDLAPVADQAGLLRVAATLRPEHLLVGEISGAEVGELLLLSARGQDGLIAALASRSPADALSRLAALASIALGAPAAAAASLLAQAFDLVVQVVAATDGSVRVVEIAEPRADGAELSADVALAFYGDGGRRDPGAGRLQGRGVSARLGAALAAAGSPLPPALLGK
jgi:pilus assembly protein CpaF